MHQCTSVSRERYALEAETRPPNAPRWWRGLWHVIDQWASNRAVVESFRARGAGELRRDCLNGTAPTVLCRSSAPAESRTEAWAWAA